MKKTLMKRHINKPAGIPCLANSLAARLLLTLPVLVIMGGSIAGCTPSVKVEAPDKPITINLNVKIEHEIRVRVDKELDDVFSADSGLF